MKVAGPAAPEALLTEGLDQAMALMSTVSADALRRVADYDEQRLWRRDGATSMTSWLAGRYGPAWGTAQEWSVRPTPSVNFLESPRRTPVVGCPGTSSDP